MNIKETEFKLLPKQAEFLFGIPEEKFHQVDDKTGLIKVYTDISCYQGGFTCKKSTAEWLSPTGWKTMDKLTRNDLMAVYHPEDDTIKFEHPKEVFIYPADEWYELDSRSIHQINCPNHNMYFLRNGKGEFQKMKDFYDEHNRLKCGHRGKFITTFKTNGNLNIDENDLRLAVAFQADGYFKNHDKYPHQFHISKERKVERLKKLLQDKDFFIRKESNGDYRIGVELNLAYKEFPIEWYNLSEECCKIIADEIKYWDGTVDGKNQSYFSSIEQNVDIIQMCVTYAGYKSTKRKRTRKSPASNKDVTIFELKYQNNNVNPSYMATRHKNVIKHYKAEKGEKKYCPSTSTKLWVCREFGRITVTGNSGKTFCGSLRGLYYAFKYPGIKGFVGASTQDLIDNTTKAQYIDHLDNMGMKEGEHYYWSDRKTQLNLINGSKIYFKTLSNPDQFRSYNLGFVEFEEASLISEYGFTTLLSRLRQPIRSDWDEHFYYALFMHTNPGGTRGWINKRFINPKTRTEGYRYVTASTRENIFLHSGYVEMMEKAYSKDQAQELIEGKDVDYDNTIAFPDFDESNIRDNLPFNSDEDLILTCDFNYNPMCWYLVQYYNDTWHILREIIEESITTGECCRRAQVEIDQLGVKKFLLMGDAAGAQRKTNGSDYGIMMSYFVNKGYNVTPRVQKANPLIKERLAVLRGYIRNVKGEKRLLVDSSCVKLLENFDKCRNNLSNGGLKIPTDTEIQKDNSLRYLVHPIDAVSYPIWFMNNLNLINNKASKKQ